MTTSATTTTALVLASSADSIPIRRIAPVPSKSVSAYDNSPSVSRHRDSGGYRPFAGLHSFARCETVFLTRLLREWVLRACRSEHDVGGAPRGQRDVAPAMWPPVAALQGDLADRLAEPAFTTSRCTADCIVRGECRLLCSARRPSSLRSAPPHPSNQVGSAFISHCLGERQSALVVRDRIISISFGRRL